MSFLDKIIKRSKKGKKDGKDNKVDQKKDIKESKDQAKKKEDHSSLKLKSEAGLTPASKDKDIKVKRTSKEDTGDAYKVLIKPLVTEKATDLAVISKYCFEVGVRANKIQIKKAIKDLYNVDPIDVNIVINRGKSVRYGRVTGKTKKWKKAIITLKQGDKIEIYEGV